MSEDANGARSVSKTDVEGPTPSAHANARKEEQLGMPFGTACNRLRKRVMFTLLVRLGENVCFRCGNPILTADEMSIEHKQHWMSVAVTLFWDLNNIGFSHRTCNTAAKRILGNHRGGTPRRKIGAEGTAWCVGHQSFLPIEAFSNNRHTWNKLDANCIACRKTMR